MTTTTTQPATTRAVGIRVASGPLEALSLPLRDPGPGEVLIRLAAAGVGQWDQYERNGLLGELPLPRALGWEGSGTIEAVGEQVSGLRAGDPVIAYERLTGFYAERVIVPATGVARAPANVPLADAAALPIAGSTAWQALVEQAAIEAGQTVLITAGAGGTGTLAIELAKHLGAHVIATAGPDNHAFLSALGADEVLDYHDPDVAARIRNAHADGVHVLLDCVSPENWALHAPLVRRGGHAVGITPPLPEAPDGVTRTELFSRSDSDTLRQITTLVEKGVLHPRVGRRYPLADAQLAQDELATRHGRGRVLLTL